MLFDTLNNIRLAAVLQEAKTPGAVKAIYKLEELSDMENEIMEALNIKGLHNKRPKIKGVSVYSQNPHKSLRIQGFLGIVRDFIINSR